VAALALSVLVMVAGMASAGARLRARRRREYLAWPVRLTGHDQTLVDDLVAAVGSIGRGRGVAARPGASGAGGVRVPDRV
jgi:hypothetical protein